MRRTCLLLVAVLLGLPAPLHAHCGCRPARIPTCATEALHRVTVRIDLTAVDGKVEVLTQSGPYQEPVADLDGKQVIFLFMPRGEVFQGFFGEEVHDSINIGTMQGATASITTAAVFAPGEYELLLFINAVPDVGLGPQRGDLAAFDNTVCDPTGVSVRVPVGCEDTSVTLTNKHFILF